MLKLLWAERQKIRRSKIVGITIFATILIATFVFISGLRIYMGPEVNYGLKTVYDSSRYIDNAGWFMDEIQPWATFFVLPSIVALLGSYMICREEEDDTIKSLRLIPINETKLTVAKMILTFGFSILLYFLLFVITFTTEAVLHFSDLSAELIFRTLKEYLLNGVGVFLAVSPIIALTSRIKKYWLALVFAEIYSIGGMFAGMSSVLKNYYPITAIFNLSGYHITTLGNTIISVTVLLLCLCISGLILRGLNRIGCS